MSRVYPLFGPGGVWFPAMMEAAANGLAGLFVAIRVQREREQLMWRCLYCDRPVPHPGEPCCKKGRHAQ